MQPLSGVQPLSGLSKQQLECTTMEGAIQRRSSQTTVNGGDTAEIVSDEVRAKECLKYLDTPKWAHGLIQTVSPA